MHDIKEDHYRNLLKKLSVDDFLHVGVNQIAYIKPLDCNHDNASYSVHAADGTQISVMESYDMAIAAVRYNDMQPVTLH